MEGMSINLCVSGCQSRRLGCQNQRVKQAGKGVKIVMGEDSFGAPQERIISLCNFFKIFGVTWLCIPTVRILFYQSLYL